MHESVSSKRILSGIGVSLIALGAIWGQACGGSGPEEVSESSAELGGGFEHAKERACQNLVRSFDRRIAELEAICGEPDAGAGDDGGPVKSDAGGKDPKPDAGPLATTNAVAGGSNDPSDPHWHLPGLFDHDFGHDDFGFGCHHHGDGDDDHATKVCQHELAEIQTVRQSILDKCHLAP